MNWTKKKGIITIVTVLVIVMILLSMLSRSGSEPYRYAPARWKRVPGNLKDISIDGVMAVGTNNNNNVFFTPDIRTGKWTRVPGKLEKVSLSGISVAGVNKNGKIYYVDNVKRLAGLGNNDDIASDIPTSTAPLDERINTRRPLPIKGGITNQLPSASVMPSISSPITTSTAPLDERINTRRPLPIKGGITNQLPSATVMPSTLSPITTSAPQNLMMEQEIMQAKMRTLQEQRQVLVARLQKAYKSGNDSMVYELKARIKSLDNKMKKLSI